MPKHFVSLPGKVCIELAVCKCMLKLGIYLCTLLTKDLTYHADTPLSEPFLPLDLVVPCLLIHRNLHDLIARCSLLRISSDSLVI